ncbi:MAG: hypothetical protein IPJ41_09320 [Phycisphaerales bacterium]|nr:hypothetical protein [Phycisphaerales bacterium]
MRQRVRGAGLAAALSGLVGAVALGACRSSGVRAVQVDGGTGFPRVSGQNLLQETVHLPDDLVGRPTLALVAFRREQQADVDTWLAREDELSRSISALRVLEFPTISGARYGMFAGFIDGGMRSGIPDPAARERTITLYTDTEKFRQALGLGGPDSIYAVLLDARARVVRVEPGPADDEKVASLLGALATP